MSIAQAGYCHIQGWDRFIVHAAYRCRRAMRERDDDEVVLYASVTSRKRRMVLLGCQYTRYDGGR